MKRQYFSTLVNCKIVINTLLIVVINILINLSQTKQFRYFPHVNIYTATTIIIASFKS